MSAFRTVPEAVWIDLVISLDGHQRPTLKYIWARSASANASFCILVVQPASYLGGICSIADCTMPSP